MKSIPFSKPDIIDEDIKSVVEVIQSGWLAHGKYSELLENLFCEFTGAKYATTVSNCTAGLHLCCLAAGFNKGDEIIVPAQTHTATAHAVEYTGAKPIFIDIDPTNGNIDIDLIQTKISNQTKGIIPVHMAGYPCEMKKIKKLCEDNNLKFLFTEIAKEWHPSKNGDLKPEEFTPGSNKKFWWLCPKGHSYYSLISPRTRPVKPSGCPYCSENTVTKENNLMVTFPNIAKEWHQSKNGKLKPDQFKFSSSKKVWWLCKYGHEYETKIIYRTRKDNPISCTLCVGV